MYEKVHLFIKVAALMIATYFTFIVFPVVSINLLEDFGTINEHRVAYNNITICDKIYDSGLIEDDFEIIYRIDSTGEIVRDNNMTLFYSVEEGEIYNASFYENTTYLVGLN